MRLSHHYVVPHISTGDMLRAAVKTGSALGLKVKETMDSGELLGDDLIMEMVAERLAEPDARARGFILDGCPRTTRQAEVLASLLAPDDLDLTVDIEVPTTQALRRLASRRVCIDCGANYSVSVPAQGQLDLRRLRWRGHPARGRHRGGHRAPPGALRAPDGAAHRLVRVTGPAGQGERRGLARRRASAGHPGRGGPPGPGGSPDEAHRRGDRQDAPGRQGGGRDARGHPRGGPARA